MCPRFDDRVFIISVLGGGRIRIVFDVTRDQLRPKIKATLAVNVVDGIAMSESRAHREEEDMASLRAQR